MKWEYTDDNGKERTANIPDDWIRNQCLIYGIDVEDAAEMWLSDHELIENETVAELTKKAQGITNRVESGKRKAPARKPDMVKQGIIAGLHDYLLSGPEQNVTVANPERMITFTLGDDNYELVLTKKRKPKN